MATWVHNAQYLRHGSKITIPEIGGSSLLQIWGISVGGINLRYTPNLKRSEKLCGITLAFGLQAALGRVLFCTGYRKGRIRAFFFFFFFPYLPKSLFSGNKTTFKDVCECPEPSGDEIRLLKIRAIFSK